MPTTKDLIVITGAAGFIGSRLAAFLNTRGFKNLVLVDAFDRADKAINLDDLVFAHKVDRDIFFNWLKELGLTPGFVFHLGARTDTTEFDYEVHRKLNLEYSQLVWQYCTENKVPLVYASSAATYGTGEKGYDDDHAVIDSLKPLNPYGESKNEFDKWVLHQEQSPPFWAGLKFFNVYGPNEYQEWRV